ncbi:MAG TPA: MFS transporter [Myxococcaceae bacterium]|nr:MFS transporter [Myxococcaceae bacterium]
MRRSPLLPIFLIVVVDVLGLTIILPLLPFYAQSLGASATQVGLLISVFSLCSLFSGPLLGRLSDRMGRKPLLVLSQVGTLTGFLVLAGAQTLWVAFLGRIIDGLTAGNLSLAQAYIADVTEPKNRSRAFALIGIAFGLGFLVGPAVSGFLSQYGYPVPILTAAGLSLTSILATTFLLPGGTPHAAADDPGPGGRRLSLLAWGQYVQYFRRPGLGPLLWQFFCFTFAFASFTAGLALFCERRLFWHGKPFGPEQVGYVFAYAGLLGVILQGGFIGRLVHRFGETALVTSGFVAATVGYAILAVTFGIPLLLLAGTISSFGNGVLRPTLTSLITQQVNRTEQGVVLGLNQSLLSTSQILGPALAGWLIDRGQLSLWAALAGAVTLLGLAINRAVPQPRSATAQSGG